MFNILQFCHDEDSQYEYNKSEYNISKYYNKVIEETNIEDGVVDIFFAILFILLFTTKIIGDIILMQVIKHGRIIIMIIILIILELLKIYCKKLNNDNYNNPNINNFILLIILCILSIISIIEMIFLPTANFEIVMIFSDYWYILISLYILCRVYMSTNYCAIIMILSFIIYFIWEIQSIVAFANRLSNGFF